MGDDDGVVWRGTQGRQEFRHERKERADDPGVDDCVGDEEEFWADL